MAIFTNTLRLAIDSNTTTRHNTTMRKLRLAWDRLLGRDTVQSFNLLGQPLQLAIVDKRELKRARDVGREEHLVERMRTHLQNDDTIYDVGANIGVLSLLLAMHANGAAARVYSFEPEPRNFAQLVRNIEVNGLADTIYPQQMALAADAGEGTLHIRGTAGEGRHSLSAAKGSTDSIVVPLNTASAFAAQHQPAPSVVKIDVEGAEGQVLAGMRQLLEQQTPRELFLEVHTKGDGDRMPNGQTISDWLADLGYQLVWNQQRNRDEHRHYQYG